MNRSRRLGVLLTLALALLAPVIPASAAPAPSAAQAVAPEAGPAQQPPAPQPPQAVTFGVRPAKEKAPDDRRAFTFGAAPGATLHDFVAVTNVTATPLTLKVYAADAFNTADGGFDLLAAGRPSRDVGAWTVLDHDSITLPARSTGIMPFRVQIPASATPGDHAAGIVASLTTNEFDAKGEVVQVDHRVGARIYLRVAGDLKPGLEIGGLAVAFHQTLNPFGRGAATVSYTVHNTGNLRLEGPQQVRLRSPWGTVVDGPQLPDLPELLPGNVVAVSTEVSGVFPSFWRVATVRLDPVAPPGDQDPVLPSAVASQTFATVPWALLVLVALLGLAVLAWRRRVRRRDAGGPRGRSGPRPVTTESAEVAHAALQ